ncbi:protein lethal(2)essential for life-like [Frieseomelitta varia]|uniref:protein lethal(2)essential for life-like n=1 Tax=Frieseomelitta varia TaxID=561572 RepID=UPI001CB6AE65|nr:protein lethal(2)essential for life-like [Frieseomelitta varia]
MSLLPLLFSAWWANLDRLHQLQLRDQNFGMGLYPEQLVLPSTLDTIYPRLANKDALDFYYLPLAELIRRRESDTSTIIADKNMFKVMLDVQQFKPEEITVKLINGFVVVEAKHEEKRDQHGLISRQFVRRYLLPQRVDDEKLSSNISSDGILTITAPLKPTEEKSNERTIKIEFTGKPAIRTTTEKTEDTKKSISTEESREETTQETPEK